MAKSTAKQKYIILERHQNRDQWDLFTGFTASDWAKEFDTVQEAMNFIRRITADDVEYFGDMEFKIAAINDDTIRLKKCVTCNLEIHKD